MRINFWGILHPRLCLLCFMDKENSDICLRDTSYMLAVEMDLNLSPVPAFVFCQEIEQEKVIRFCKTAVCEWNPQSMCVSYCPGTKMSLTMEKLQILLCTEWTREVGNWQVCGSGKQAPPKKNLLLSFLYLFLSLEITSINRNKSFCCAFI
jgi:hypothetical protein